MNIRFFNNKIDNFITSLEKITIAKALRTIDLLERFGNDLGIPHSKKVCKGIFELRVRGNQEIRIFYTFHKNEIVMLHAFVKKKQKLPMQELDIAIKHLKSLVKL